MRNIVRVEPSRADCKQPYTGLGERCPQWRGLVRQAASVRSSCQDTLALVCACSGEADTGRAVQGEDPHCRGDEVYDGVTHVVKGTLMPPPCQRLSTWCVLVCVERVERGRLAYCANVARSWLRDSRLASTRVAEADDLHLRDVRAVGAVGCRHCRVAVAVEQVGEAGVRVDRACSVRRALRHC